MVSLEIFNDAPNLLILPCRLTPNRKWDRGWHCYPNGRILTGLIGACETGLRDTREEAAPYSLDTPGANAYLGCTDNKAKQVL